MQANPLSNHQPALLTVPAGQEAGLRAQVSVLIPASDRPPPLNMAAAGPIGQAREKAILDLLAASPATSWLGSAAPRWHMELSNWNITDSNGRTITTATSAAHLDQAAAAGSQKWQQILIGAQFRSGLAADQSGGGTGEPMLLLTVVVGIWLAEFSADHRADEQRHSQETLLAAMTLGEAYDLLAALTRCCADIANAALPRLVETSAQPREILIDLMLEAPAGLGAVVDLSKMNRVGRANQTQYKQAFKTTADPRGVGAPAYVPGVVDVAASALGEWLLQAGYREYEQPLRDAWQQLKS